MADAAANDGWNSFPGERELARLLAPKGETRERERIYASPFALSLISGAERIRRRWSMPPRTSAGSGRPQQATRLDDEVRARTGTPRFRA